MTIYCVYSGKERFQSQHSANRAIRSMAGKHKGKGRVYRCVHCSDWHTTRRVTEPPLSVRKGKSA